jgi:hypothetical protein
VFTGVTILPEDEDLAEREKRIIITVSERRSQYLESSGGVSTGQGVRASVEYGYTNLFNYAISAIIRVQLGYQFFFVERSIQERYERLVLGDRLGQRVSIGFAAPYIPALPNTRASLDLVLHTRQRARLRLQQVQRDPNACLPTIATLHIVDFGRARAEQPWLVH